MTDNSKNNQDEQAKPASGGFNFQGPASFNQSQLSTGDIHNQNVTFSGSAITPDMLAELFAPLATAVKSAPPEKRADAEAKLEELKQETAKGAKAEDSTLARVASGLADLVPGAVSALVAAFANPLLAGIAGPVTKFVVDGLKQKLGTK